MASKLPVVILIVAVVVIIVDDEDVTLKSSPDDKWASSDHKSDHISLMILSQQIDSSDTSNRRYNQPREILHDLNYDK